MEPRVAVVIVNWNKGAETVRCIASVRASTYPWIDLVVVDNASSDKSVEVIEGAYPNLPLLRTAQNIGFTGGYNLGIRHALARGADYVFLLNDDAVIAPDTIHVLVMAAQANPDAGFLGPRIDSLEERDVLLSAGGLLREGWKTVHRGLGERECGQFDRLEQVDYLSGCALLVSRRAIEAVGMLDDDFFAYYEDVEWCCRGRRAGFQVLFAPEAVVWHPDTRRRDNTSVLLTYYLARNSLIFAKKQRLGYQARTNILMSHVRTLMSWSLRPRWRNKYPQRHALYRALTDYLHGTTGKAEGLS